MVDGLTPVSELLNQMPEKLVKEIYGRYLPGYPKRVLPLDKSLNNGFLFYVWKFLDSKYLLIGLGFDTSDSQSKKNSWRYTKLKANSRFHKRQNWEILGYRLASRRIVVNGHL